MRFIDSKISAMITKGLNKEKFDRKLSKRDRVVSDGTGKVSVFLWKTEIAEFDPYVNEIIVKDGGHQTVTTKSRINAMQLARRASAGIAKRNRMHDTTAKKTWHEHA